MTERKQFLGRRMLLASAAGIVVVAAAPVAWALTGIAALDTPAIPVKTPDAVLLVAIKLTPGNRLVAVGEHGVIIYSDDSGMSWKQASVPVNVTLTCVNFATAEIGWAAGHFGVVLNTQDSGRSWQMQLDGIQANKLTMAAAADSSLATNPSPGASVALRRAQHFADSGPDKPFLTMLLFSPQKLIVFGAYRLTMLSIDGGRTWQDWSLHIYDKYSHNIYGAATIGDIDYIVAEEGLMFNSTDGGDTFLPMTSPGNVSLLGILGTKDSSLIVFGVAGFAARSTDGGKRWTMLSIASQQDLTSGLVLNSGAVILIDEAGLMFESTDSGASFSRLEGIQPQPFFDVQATPNGGLIAVGAAGVTHIAKSLLAS